MAQRRGRLRSPPYDDWQAKRQAEEKRPIRIAEGSLAAAFEEYRQTQEWAAKADRTREEWERCWAVIGPAFGPCRPSTITLAQISTFRRMVEANVSLREAHRCIKIWRALWRVAAALKYCQRDADPSLGVRNVEPKPRQAVWEHSEVVRLAKGAWRAGYKGLAAVMAVAWDTSFSPVDVRSLRPSIARETLSTSSEPRQAARRSGRSAGVPCGRWTPIWPSSEPMSRRRRQSSATDPAARIRRTRSAMTSVISERWCLASMSDARSRTSGDREQSRRCGAARRATDCREAG